MVLQLSFQAPSLKMENLNNLWFQLSNKACNLKCKHCFLSCDSKYNSKSFIPIDKIKAALEATKKEEIKNIYLTGGEPLLHPEFNNIVRLCLKRANTTVLTNGTMLNDKKVRFLRQLEDNFEYELIFRVSLDHYDELKNDRIRARGHFRKAVNGIQNLLKYEFNPIMSIVNYENMDEELLKENFQQVFDEIGFETEDINYKIIPCIKKGNYATNYGKYSENEFIVDNMLKDIDKKKFDCATSRVVAIDGVYSCPALVGDSRGKIGVDMYDFSDRVFLESSVCYTCATCKGKMFNNNW